MENTAASRKRIREDALKGLPPPRRILFPLDLGPQRHPAFPMGQWRAWAFNSAANGFDKCLVRAGRRLYVDEALFFDWLDSISELSRPAPGEKFGKLPTRVQGGAQ